MSGKRKRVCCLGKQTAGPFALFQYVFGTIYLPDQYKMIYPCGPFAFSECRFLEYVDIKTIWCDNENLIVSLGTMNSRNKTVQFGI